MHTLLAKVHYPAAEQQHQAVKEAECCNPAHTTEVIILQLLTI